MSTQITVTLPDDTYRRAEYLARITGRELNDVLADTIQVSLQPLGIQAELPRPVSELSDVEVLTAADAQMAAESSQRFSQLLEQQQAGRLTDTQRSELTALIQIYQDGLLRKAQALHEAVRRGLRSSLTP